MLNKVDIKALKTAENVSFSTNGKSTIRCTKKITVDGAFEAEAEHIVGVNGYIGKNYGDTRDYSYAREHLSYAHTNDQWQTVASMLREGDEITLRWSADGGRNGYIEGVKRIETAGAGTYDHLHADRFYIDIARPGKNRPFTFLIAAQTCPDNTARMIQ